MLVELDVFSGRPNPRWKLDDPVADDLRGLVSLLPVTTDGPPEPPGLGYRGFTFSEGTGRIRAYKGYVITSDVVLADPSSSVERFLLGRIPPEFQDLRQRVALEFQGG
jgi:hypothetical protein